MPYKGAVAPIPLGAKGLSGSVNQARLQPDDLLIANNLSLFHGTIRKEGGTSAYNSTAITGTPSVIGGHDWWPSSGTQRMIVLTDAGDLLKDDGTATFSTTLASGLTVANITPQFVEGGKEAAANNRKLFAFTGSNAVQVLSGDGATTTNLGTPPADWAGTNQPTFGLVHEGRLWGGGNANDPHRLYYSIATDHEDFTTSDAGTLAIYPGEGEKLVAAVSFRGFIICWKYPVGVYIVDTTDPTIANWKVSRLTEKVGTLNNSTVIVAANDVYFMAVSGNPHLLSATAAFGDLSDSSFGSIHEMDSFIRSNVNTGQLTLTRAAYYEAKKEIHWALPGIGATTNNSRLVLDLNQLNDPRFLFCDRDTAVSLWVRKDGNGVHRLVYGDDSGVIYDMDQDTRSHKSAGYTGKFQTAYTDLAFMDPKLGTIRKNSDFLEIVAEPKGNWNLSVDVNYDGSYHETVQFNMGTTGAVLGSFVLGTDKLAEEQVINKKKRITGSGRRVSFAGYNNGDGEDFSIASLYYHFRPGDERL